MGDVTHMNESCHTYEWVMPHLSMSHVIHMNESWYTYEWVMSHIWMSHGTHMNESCHTYECVCRTVMPNISMSPVTHMHKSWHTYQMSHGTHMTESYHTCEGVMLHIEVHSLSSLCVHSRAHTIYTWGRNDSCAPWLTHLGGTIIMSYVWQESRCVSNKSLLQNIVSFIGLFCKRDL